MTIEKRVSILGIPVTRREMSVNAELEPYKKFSGGLREMVGAGTADSLDFYDVPLGCGPIWLTRTLHGEEINKGHIQKGVLVSTLYRWKPTEGVGTEQAPASLKRRSVTTK